MSEKHALLERMKIRDVYPFSWRVFFTWDFSVTSRSGVITKHKVLIRELKVSNDHDVFVYVWVISLYNSYKPVWFLFPFHYTITKYT